MTWPASMRQQGIPCVTLGATAAWSILRAAALHHNTLQYIYIYTTHKRQLNSSLSSQSPQTCKAHKTMGTRNLTLVYYKGQYGQWDGYPDGQGLTILHFLLDAINIADLQKVLDDSDKRVILISDEERDAYFEDLLNKQIETRSFLPLPVIESLSRDTGAKILEVVACATQEEPVEIHLWDVKFLADELFMEWAWVVDLDKKVLEAYTYWNKYKVMDEKSRFEEVLGSEKKLPGLVKRLRFDELPEYEMGFLGAFEALLVDGAE
jgi:hypothetical protein